jgi:hypothetical protein
MIVLSHGHFSRQDVFVPEFEPAYFDWLQDLRSQRAGAAEAG